MSDNPFDVPENPYAAPNLSGGYQAGGESGSGIISVDGKDVLCHDSVRFPEICIRTGQSNDLVQVSKPLYWAPGWIFLLILLNLLIMAIVFFIVRKRVDVIYYIERSERSSMRWKVFFGILLLFGGIAGVVFSIVSEFFVLLIFAFIALFAGLILAIKFSNPLKPVKHKDRVFHIRGCDPSFLNQLKADVGVGY